MDEYPDLVARLREKAAEVNGFGADIFDEAADRILELERESKRPKPGFADGYSLALIQAASPRKSAHSNMPRTASAQHKQRLKE